MVSRRQVLKAGTVTGAATLVPAALIGRRAAQAAAVPGGTLDPTTIRKYATPLFVIPAMPPGGYAPGMDVFSIGARRFSQQMLPSGYPRTTVLGFGATGNPGTFHTPGYTIEAQVNRPVRVTWWNQLTDSRGNFVPHPLTIDPTLHW